MMRLEPRQQTIYTRIVALMTNYDIEPTVVISGLAAVGWGIMVFNPWVDTFSTSPSFRAMAYLALEWKWGLGVFSIGLVQIVALYRKHVLWQQRATFLAMLTWGFVSFTLIISNPWSTGTVIYPGLTLIALWAYWRLALLLRPTHADES